jgi:hypothetical protein
MPRGEKVRIVLASGARARWVERVRDEKDLITLGEIEPSFAPHHKGPAFVSFESAAPGMRHGVGERGEARRRREEFAAQIAETLNRQDADDEYQRLVLVAPARLLRAIRDHLSDGARSKIRLELAKDLTKKANHDLRTWLHGPAVI